MGHIVTEIGFIVPVILFDLQRAKSGKVITAFSGIDHIIFMFLQWYPLARLNDAVATVRRRTQNTLVWRLLEQNPPAFDLLGYRPSVGQLARAGASVAATKLILPTVLGLKSSH